MKGSGIRQVNLITAFEPAARGETGRAVGAVIARVCKHKGRSPRRDRPRAN